MPNPLVVPVVAHRMFGRSYVARRVRWAPVPGRFIDPFGRWDGVMPEFVLEEAADTSHGTRRSVEEIQRLFHEGETPDFTHEWSVNRLWGDTGIQFALVGVVDEMIDSHVADFFPADVRLWPDLTPRHLAGALNLYFFRELEGARGYGHPDRAILADRWDPGADTGSRADAWRVDVITVSHEIGHMFRLSHREETGNVMFGHGTWPASTALTGVQAAFAQQTARQYRRPWFRGLSRLDQLFLATVETAHARAYAGERLPSFD